MSFFRETTRTARKEHWCDLCGKSILKGEKYTDHADNMMDESQVCYLKQCDACEALVREFLKDDPSDGYNADDMREWWNDRKCRDCKKQEDCPGLTHYCRCEAYAPEEQEDPK